MGGMIFKDFVFFEVSVVFLGTGPCRLQRGFYWGIEAIMKSICLLVACLMMVGCTRANPVPPGKIVFLGDSLTDGFGLDPSEAYPALLSGPMAARGLTVVNAGISGDTTAGGLGRMGSVVGPDTRILVIALGANDVLSRSDPAAMKSNLLAIIKNARAINPDVRILLAGIRFGFPLDTAGYSGIISDVANETDVTHLPHLLKGVMGDPRLNQQDGLHPTAEGQKMMAQTVMEGLEPLL